MERNGSVEQNPAPSGAPEGVSGGQEVGASTQTPNPEEGVKIPEGDFVPRSVMEEQLKQRERHFQSVADKQIADLRKELTVPQFAPQPQPQQQAPAPQAEFDRERFAQLLDSDPSAGLDYFVQGAQAKMQSSNQPVDVQAQIQQALEAERAQGAYVQSVNAAVAEAGLTLEEKNRAEQYIADHFQSTGNYIDPNMAAMVGRFGSPAQAMTLANAQMLAMSQQQPLPAPGQPQAAPPVTAGPGLPGGGLPNQSTVPQAAPPGGSLAGTWKQALGK